MLRPFTAYIDHGYCVSQNMYPRRAGYMKRGFIASARSRRRLVPALASPVPGDVATNRIILLYPVNLPVHM